MLLYRDFLKILCYSPPVTHCFLYLLRRCMENFSQLNIPPLLLKSLQEMGYNKPTPVQEKAIPSALEGRDVLGSAQTGTGKTAAFGIPLVNYLMKSKMLASALILTPTRELAEQVYNVMNGLTKNQPAIRTALLIGGENIRPQIQQLRMRPRIMVGTPGRIIDHIGQGSLILHSSGFLVLDEMDRMLDIGFEEQIEQIMKYLPANRQTLMFSATMPETVIRLSAKYMNNPVRISLDLSQKPSQNIRQETLNTSEGGKYSLLKEELNKREGTVIIFVKTKKGVDKLARQLSKEGFKAEAIHGDLHQSHRQAVIKAFRNEEFRILVATDVASRGLDISHVAHVINFDLPQAPEDYIHRIGRTARAGAEGDSLTFLTPDDSKQWQEIKQLMGGEKTSETSRSHDDKNTRESGGSPAKKTSSRRRNRNRNKSSRKS